MSGFDITAPLPAGVTVLEASAGTGKTYTIAALAVRFIAEGRPLHELLLVTFTRMATGELRERVRERLVDAEQQLSRCLAGARCDDSDDLIALLTRGSAEDIEPRRARIANAISNFDAATIATTHGFCQEVLAELGTLGDLEPEVEFTEDVDDLIEQVIDDLYVRRFFRRGGARFDRAQAGQIARMAIDNPGAVIHPLTAAEDSDAAMRRRLARRACEELEHRKRLLGVMTYDDQLTRLRDVLTGTNGVVAVHRLRSRYRVVLIDEFQDTDPVQWEIVSTAFGGGGVTLVLIADPKQAIYAFRGADVYAYLAAARASPTRPTLRVNWRSDQALLDAYDGLFGNAKLGHPEIAYRRVRASAGNKASRLRGAPVAAALRVRVVDRNQPSIKLTARGFAESQSARAYVAKDVAADVVALLSSGASIRPRPGPSGAEHEDAPVTPGDIAVLVRSHRNAALVHDELIACGVPAVINGAGSVFGSPAARDWLHLLQALERPAHSARARAAALTPLLGWNAERVALSGEDELEVLHQRLHAWARVLRLRGMAALADAIFAGEQVPARVLQVVDGERRLTDLQHVAQLLHDAATSGQLGAAALTGWLRQRIAGAEEEGNRDELTRRLESDAEAAQVLTIHRSKGLEFPVVYCPFLWEASWIPEDRRPIYFHDPDERDRRAIDVGLEGASFYRHRDLHRIEERGEDLRLLYVALTRARHQTVIWWVGSSPGRDSPLTRLLFARDIDGNVAASGSRRPSDADAFARFAEVADCAPGAVSVEHSRLGLPTNWGGGPAEAQDLAVARFDRHLDGRWRRTSYSDITAGAHEAFVGSEPEVEVISDELLDPVVAGRVRAVPAPASPLASMPVGARVGTFVHRVLQSTDFTAPDLTAELLSQIEGEQRRGRVEIGDPVAVAAGLAAAVETPFDGLRLRGVRPQDRLDELEFELPLAGGDDPFGRLTVDAIARALRSHLAPEDPFYGYAARLADPTLRHEVGGYLTGSIDLVLRLPGPRFAIVDYKTNWLGAVDEPLTAWHYRPDALEAEMLRTHYALQALLYAAALHRYLRWRLPGYDASACFAGVHYLFLRGMLGADSTGGAFSWYPPGSLIAQLSDVLDGVS